MALGCSLGSRRQRLELTARQLGAHPHIEIVRCSRLYRTPPMRGGTARGWFLNAVLRIRTELDPHALLQVTRALEGRAGRRRARYWGDRTLDIDLLLFAGCVVNDPDLTLPHPGIRARPFVLTPLLEVWPEAVDPTSNQPYSASPTPPPPHAVPIGCLSAGVDRRTALEIRPATR